MLEYIVLPHSFCAIKVGLRNKINLILTKKLLKIFDPAKYCALDIMVSFSSFTLGTLILQVYAHTPDKLLSVVGKRKRLRTVIHGV